MFDRKHRIAMSGRTNRTDDDKQPQQQPAARIPLVRNPVATRRFVSLTPDTRLQHIQAATFHNYTANWVRFHSLYNCDCGRQIGYAFQEPILEQPTARIDDEVISIHSTPPPSVNHNLSISSEDAAAIVIDDSTDSSTELLVERVGYTEPVPDPSEADLRSIYSSATDAQSSKSSSDEPMC